MTSTDKTTNRIQDTPPRPEPLHDFRMEAVGFEILELARGHRIEAMTATQGIAVTCSADRPSGSQRSARA